MHNFKTTGMSLLEVIASIAIAAGVVFLLTPYFRHNRTSSCRVTCGQNMGQIHKAITMYETDYEMYPTRAAEGKDPLLDGDAQEALNLLYRQYIDDARVFSCPSKRLPSTLTSEIKPSTSTNWPGTSGTYFKEALPGATVSFSTSYGYSPGHTSENSRVIVLADHKGVGSKGNSDNHGFNAGQNVLSSGGSISWQPSIENPLGKDDASESIFDPDIFSTNKIQASILTDKKIKFKEMPEWDSFCR